MLLRCGSYALMCDTSFTILCTVRVLRVKNYARVQALIRGISARARINIPQDTYPNRRPSTHLRRLTISQQAFFVNTYDMHL